MEQDNVSKEFAGLVGDEWHEWIDTRFYNNPTGPNGLFQYEHGCACGNGVWSNRKHYPTQLCTPNRKYIIELIKARIQARGDWDGFAGNWLWSYSLMPDCNDNYYDILTTPALLMQAYIAYRRQA